MDNKVEQSQPGQPSWTKSVSASTVERAIPPRLKRKKANPPSHPRVEREQRLSMSVLAHDKALVGCDLARVFEHYRRGAGVAGGGSDEDEFRFKKKELVSATAKSLLKHRIQTLTGLNMADIELRLGYDLLRDGRSMGVADIRRLARLLLLEAHERLPDATPASAAPAAPAAPVARKRTHSDASPAQKTRTSRRSVAPLPAARPALRGRGAPAPPRPSTDEESEADEPPPPEEEEDETLGLDNPTPVMLALRRKSLGGRQVMKRANGAVTVVKRKTPASPAPPRSYPGAAYQDHRGVTRTCHVSLVRGVSLTLKFPTLQAAVPGFAGAHLAVVHTPADWGRGDVSNMVQCIRAVNHEAGLGYFTVLVGSVIETLPIFTEALLRHTQHVQPVVIDREDQHLSSPEDHKLRETCTFFLLAYFFPGCTDRAAALPVPMVRKGMTNCFRAQNVEDLENTIIHALTVEGDCVLDLCCGTRELSLAAQKAGRHAVAVDEDEAKLAQIRTKATAIAQFHDRSFRGSPVSR